MKTLIPINSPRYIRRLVREINANLSVCYSVYVADPESGNNLRVKRVKASKDASAVLATDYYGKTVTAGPESFIDANGGTICASRR